jgi:hypothetical protein
MISGVLETVQVQLFYGSKEVRYGMEGVDLSEFSSVVKEVKRADERSGGGHDQLAVQCNITRFGAIWVVGNDTIQQKYSTIVGAYDI